MSIVYESVLHADLHPHDGGKLPARPSSAAMNAFVAPAFCAREGRAAVAEDDRCDTGRRGGREIAITPRSPATQQPEVPG